MRGTKTCENTTEKLKTAGAAQESTKTLLEVVLGLKNKDKGQNDKGKEAKEGEHSEKARGRRRGSHAGDSSSDEADGNGGEEDGTEEEEEDTAALERERERRQHQQRKQRERQKQAQETRQRAAELAELKEYREVLKEELASLWAAMGRCRPTPPPTPLPPVAVEGQLDKARREALRLRRENDALVAELRDLDALILQAEAEGVHVFARPPPPASGSGGGGAVAGAGRGGGSRNGEVEQPRRRPPAAAAAQERVVGRRPPVGPTLEEMIATECEARLAALGAARKGPGKKPLAAAAVGVLPKPTREAHPTAPPSLYSPYLQLLTERGARKKKQPPPPQRAASPCCHHHHHHHHTCQSPVPFPPATPTHHLPSPSSGGSAKAPVFPRETVRRDGKTVYVRESKPIEDWIGSLRASGGSGPPTPTATPPPTAPSSLSATQQQYRSRGGVGSGGGLSPVPSPSPGGLRVPRR